jgi:hypothetical protein
LGIRGLPGPSECRDCGHDNPAVDRRCASQRGVNARTYVRHCPIVLSVSSWLLANETAATSFIGQSRAVTGYVAAKCGFNLFQQAQASECKASLQPGTKAGAPAHIHNRVRYRPNLLR